MAKLKKTDYLYASARVHANECNLLRRESIDKMIDARTAEEALKVLYQCDYGESGSELSNPADFDELLKLEQRKLHEFIMSIAPDKDLFALFFYPYDYHNLKTLLKAENVDRTADDILSDTGTIPVSKLRVMVRERDFVFMTERMRTGVTEALDSYARTGDPQMIDVTLDRYCYGDMVKAADKTRNDFVRGYVSRLIDMINLKSFVRTRAIGKSWDFFSKLFVPGGNIAERIFVSNFEESLDQMADKLMPFGIGQPLAAGAEELNQNGRFTNLEKSLDDNLMDYVRNAKYISFGIEPLIGYLVAKEADIKTARIIMAGKLSDLSSERIRERLRKTYV